jgi:hypothetical protein
MKKRLIYVATAMALFGLTISPALNAFIRIKFKDGMPKVEIEAVLTQYGIHSTLDYYDEAYWIKLTPKQSGVSLEELEETAAEITFENELRSSISLIRWIEPSAGFLQGKTTSAASESEVRELLATIPKMSEYELVLSKHTPPIYVEISFWKFVFQFSQLQQEKALDHVTFVGFNNPVIYIQNLLNTVNPPRHPDVIPKAY